MKICAEHPAIISFGSLAIWKICVDISSDFANKIWLISGLNQMYFIIDNNNRLCYLTNARADCAPQIDVADWRTLCAAAAEWTKSFSPFIVHSVSFMHAKCRSDTYSRLMDGDGERFAGKHTNFCATSYEYCTRKISRNAAPNCITIKVSLNRRQVWLFGCAYTCLRTLIHNDNSGYDDEEGIDGENPLITLRLVIYIKWMLCVSFVLNTFLPPLQMLLTSRFSGLHLNWAVELNYKVWQPKKFYRVARVEMGKQVCRTRVTTKSTLRGRYEIALPLCQAEETVGNVIARNARLCNLRWGNKPLWNRYQIAGGINRACTLQKWQSNGRITRLPIDGNRKNGKHLTFCATNLWNASFDE